MAPKNYESENDSIQQNINTKTWQDSDTAQSDSDTTVQTNKNQDYTENIPKMTAEEQAALNEKRNSPEFQQGLQNVLPKTNASSETDSTDSGNLNAMIQQWQMEGKDKSNDKTKDKDKEQAQKNTTGIPDVLKAKMEQLSGIDLSDVKVYYNSAKPTEVGALAYTEGTNIYIGPGQEEHLEHELWHVVQQKQGRVKATTEVNGQKVDDRTEMENEADEMGNKVINNNENNLVTPATTNNNVIQQKAIIQRKPSYIKTLQVSAQTMPPEYLPENKGLWEQLKSVMTAYETVGDDDIKKRTTSVTTLKSLLDQILLTPATTNKIFGKEEQTHITWINSLIEKEEIELSLTQGSLVANAGNTEADPSMAKKLEGANAVFKKDSDIFDESESKIDQGKKGKLGLVVENWDDKNTTVKKDKYIKVKAEDAQKAGSNFQAIKEGFVNKDDIISTRRTEKNTNTKYQEKGNALENPLFPHPPVMNDVKQGKLGDCYLLAAMASVVNKDPNHFVSHIKDHGNGKVTVKLYSAPNSPVNITINKSTVVNKGGLFGYGGGKDEYAEQSLWVQMYEKAYTAAGFDGNSEEALPLNEKSYGMIEGGSSAVAMTHLTGKAGAETKKIENNADSLPEELMTLIKDEFQTELVKTNEGILEYSLLQTITPKLQEMVSKLFVPIDSLEAVLRGLEHDFGDEENPKVVKLSENTITTMLAKVKEKNLLTGSLGSGNYTQKELDFFDEIKGKIDGGKIMAISTKEKIFDDKSEVTEKGKSGGEPMVKGIAGGHAYSLLDYAPKNAQAGNTLSFKLRNPWGSYGRKYVDPKTGKEVDITSGAAWNGAERKADDKGEFWVDLADVMSFCDHYYSI